MYAGPFNQEQRRWLAKHWRNRLLATGIHVAPDGTVVDFFVGACMQSLWRLQGLPAEQQSMQNALLVTSACPQPYVADSEPALVNGQGIVTGATPGMSRSASVAAEGALRGAEDEGGSLVSDEEVAFVSAVGGSRVSVFIDPQVRTRARVWRVVGLCVWCLAPLTVW